MNKRGRPKKYEDEETRIEERRRQNRESQRRYRLFHKIKNYEEFVKISPFEWDKRYIKGIVDHFGRFNYNHFFTGTIDLNYVDKQNKDEFYDHRNKNDQISQPKLSTIERRIGINSVKNYSTKYVQYLFDTKQIDRCFCVIEEGKNRNYHVHILMNVSEVSIETENVINNHWLMGTSWTVPVDDKIKLFNYVCKELKPSSNLNRDLNKVDNWFFRGDFTKPVMVRTKKPTSRPPVYRKNKSQHKIKNEIDTIMNK